MQRGRLVCADETAAECASESRRTSDFVRSGVESRPGSQHGPNRGRSRVLVWSGVDKLLSSLDVVLVRAAGLRQLFVGGRTSLRGSPVRYVALGTCLVLRSTALAATIPLDSTPDTRGDLHCYPCNCTMIPVYLFEYMG